MTHRSRGARRLAWLVVAPLMAACSLDNEVLNTRTANALFNSYVAVGTSIGAGIQSGGINDSTQQESYPVLLAEAMGLTPGTDWYYPSFPGAGCPAPYTSILAGTRVGNASATACTLRDAASAQPFMNNVSVPSIRAAQILDVTDLTFPATDSIKLVQFVTGSLSPLAHVRRAHATLVTLEIGANDVLGAATRGSTALLTPLADFTAAYEAIANEVDAVTGGNVAAFGIPNVTNIPHFSAGAIFFCLRNAGCPAPLPSPQAPYSSANFVVDASCSPGSVGLQSLVGFTATGTITRVLSLGGAATLNCSAGTASYNAGAGFVATGPVLTPATVGAIATRVGEINAYIEAEAGARGWAFVNLNGLLDSVRAAGGIPGFPDFLTAQTTNPNALFGAFISQDGIHPNAAAHRLIAQKAASAINTTYGSTLTVP